MSVTYKLRSAMPKKGQKGQKSLKGQPELYDELKNRVMVSLTPTAVAGLDALAKSIDLSRSELVEQIGRGLFSLSRPEAVTLTPEQVNQLGKHSNTLLPLLVMNSQAEAHSKTKKQKEPRLHSCVSKLLSGRVS